MRAERPTVLAEVRNGLYYFEAGLFDLVPRLYRDLERALAERWPDRAWRVPAILRFSSWMGGDRDGNPFVTPDVTIEAVRALRVAVLRRHLASVDALGGRLSQSTREVGVSDELRASIAADDARSPELGAEARKALPLRALPAEVRARPRAAPRARSPTRSSIQPAFYRDAPLTFGGAGPPNPPGPLPRRAPSSTPISR